MRLILLLLFFYSTLIFKQADAQQFKWGISQGGNSDDMCHGVSTDANGNVYTLGTFYGAGNYGSVSAPYNLISYGQNDIILSKFNSNGSLVWVKQIGGISGEEGSSIAIDSLSNLYITGFFIDSIDFDPSPNANYLYSDYSGVLQAFICKFDSAGNFIWANKLSGMGIGLDIKVSNVGESIITGYVNNRLFIAKYDSAGNNLWLNNYSGTSSSEGRGCAYGSNGNIFITGYYEGTTEFNPILNNQSLTSPSQASAFILALDSNGAFLWVKTLVGSATECIGQSVEIDNSNNIFIGGMFSNTVDFDPSSNVYNLTSSGQSDVFIAKYSLSGDLIWSKSFGGVSDDWLYKMSIGKNSNLYFAGSFFGTSDFSPGVPTSYLSSGINGSAYFSSCDSSGSYNFAYVFGDGNSISRGFCCASDTNGNFYTAGYYKGTIDFDPTTGVNYFTSNPSPSPPGFLNVDIYLLKFSNCSPTNVFPIEGESLICQGDSINFQTDLVVNAEGYFWNVPDGSIIISGQNTKSVTVYFPSTLSGYVTVTPYNSCGNGITQTKFVTVNQLPNVSYIVSPSNTICSGNSITLSGTGAQTYVWSGGVTNGVAFVPLNSSTYSITGTSSFGCTQISTVSVNVIPSSISQIVTAPVSYFWNINGQTYFNSGTYSATSINSVGCSQVNTLILTITPPTGPAIFYNFNNFVQTAPNKFEFDVWITNTGNTSLNVRSFSFGLNTTPSMGVLNFSYIPGTKSSILNPITTYTVTTTIKGTSPNNYYHLRLLSNNAASGTEPNLLANVPYKLGRFQVTSNLNFINGLNPFLPPININPIQVTTSSGYTQCVLNTLINGGTTTYSLYGTGNPIVGTNLNSLAAQMNPTPSGTSPFLLNSCLNTASTYSVTSCDNYYWAANGFTYIASGNYTKTNLIGTGPCLNTETLQLQINHSTTSSFNISACNSYMWPINGVTYSNAGTYTNSLVNISGCPHYDTLHLSLQFCSKQLNLNCFIEGYYMGNGIMQPVLSNQGILAQAGVCDSILVELHHNYFPFAIVSSVKTLLYQNGTAICNFNVPIDSYYVAIKHRSSIEMWSANPVLLNGNTAYNFSTAAAQAYGDNQKDISGNGTLFALYSGDNMKDGNIDLYDLNAIEADIINFAYGYYASDINGDGNVDLYDLLAPEENVINFVYAVHP